MKNLCDVLEWMQAQDKNGEYADADLGDKDALNSIKVTLCQWIEDLGAEASPKKCGCLAALDILNRYEAR